MTFLKVNLKWLAISVIIDKSRLNLKRETV